MLNWLEGRRFALALGAAICVLLLLASCNAPRTPYIEGYYRSGFEESAFYPLEGGGPWWLDANGEVWDEIHSYYVDGPGRGGGITVHMSVEGDVETGGRYGHLGAYSAHITVSRIIAIEALTPTAFDQLVAERPGSADEVGEASK